MSVKILKTRAEVKCPFSTPNKNKKKTYLSVLYYFLNDTNILISLFRHAPLR